MMEAMDTKLSNLLTMMSAQNQQIVVPQQAILPTQGLIEPQWMVNQYLQVLPPRL